MKAYRSAVFHFLDQDQYEYIEDGLLLVDGGTVQKLGPYEDLIGELKGVELVTFENQLIMPGLIDGHIHFPQVDVMASYGEQLLDWLNDYTFPAEARFKDPSHCQETAQFFLNELLKNGTTTAMVFATKHPESVNAFFEASQALNTRMICGLVMMDQNAPNELLCSEPQSYNESQQLIHQWHGNGRQLYAVTPRFAITSSDTQLDQAGDLLKKNPGVYMQTHLSENKTEIDTVLNMFADAKDYLHVYEKHGLLGPHSVFAHGIHLSDDELTRLAQTGSSIAFCPTSNLFLGSGLFDLQKTKSKHVNVCLATDVGAGTSFSMLSTLNEAYKVCQLNGQNLDALTGFYMATLGNAKTLKLDDKIGNFESGKEADFIVLDLACTELIKRKLRVCNTIEEKLFSLMMLADDRLIDASYIAGQRRYKKAV